MTTADTEVTQEAIADSGFTPENIADAEWLVANMPGIRRFHDMATYERAMICHTAARFRADTLTRHRTLTPAQAAGPVLLEADREDAERWRALISSDRFKMMGAAGFIHEADGSVRVNPDSDYGWLHFGLEVWDRHPAGDDAQGRHGRNLLMAYVEHRRAITQAEGPQQ